MNSKEALEEIKDWLEYKDADWATIKYVEKIEKDLEVLEILKKHFQVYFDDETENGLEEKVFNGIDLDDIWGEGYDEDFEKIMEWLEDGN